MTLAHIRTFVSGRAFGARAIPLCVVMATSGAANAETTANCARYGADYVAVAGSNGCVRIGGHVRVNMAKTSQAPEALGYAPGQDVLKTAAAFPPFRLLNEMLPR
jgi:hypothetical protein